MSSSLTTTLLLYVYAGQCVPGCLCDRYQQGAHQLTMQFQVPCPASHLAEPDGNFKMATPVHLKIRAVPNGWFPKMGVPKKLVWNGLEWKTVLKRMIWGYLDLWKPPNLPRIVPRCADGLAVGFSLALNQ